MRSRVSVFLLFSLFIMLLLSIQIIALSIVSPTANESRIMVFLPRSDELFNVSAYDVSVYYVEFWAVSPDGIDIVKRDFVNPLNPIAVIYSKDLYNVSRKWIEFYERNSIYGRSRVENVKPAILVQISFYSSKDSKTGYAFGASIIYDPVKISRYRYVETHVVPKKDFALVRVKELNLTRTIGGVREFSSQCNKTINMQSGMPPSCTCYTCTCYEAIYKGDCNCCLEYYTKLSLGELLFDSSDPSVPSLLRGKLPIILGYLDPSSQANRIGVAYKVQRVPSIEFRVGIIDLVNKILSIGGSSLQVVIGDMGTTVEFSKNRYGMIYMPGTYKIYKAYENLCCNARICDYSYMSCDIVKYCEPICYNPQCEDYLVVIVTNVISGLGGISYISPEDLGVDINTIRSYLKNIIYQTSIQPGGFVSISPDYGEYRVSPLGIIALATPGVASVILSVIDMIVGFEVIKRTTDTIETLEVYNDVAGGVANIYIWTVTVEYSTSYRALFIDVR